MVQFTEKFLGDLLVRKLEGLEYYKEVISLVKNNVQGNIFLVGGSVSRTLASAIYGGSQIDQDFDFVVDKLNDKLNIPEGWEISYRKFGNPTFKRGDVEIDIFPFSDHKHIKENNKEPTISNFLEGVPFTIQSLAFDINTQKLIGSVGIEALRQRKFKVNNLDSARELAEKKGISINERMLQKARTMGFGIVPCD